MRVCQRLRKHLWESLWYWLSVPPFTRAFLKSPSLRSLSAIAELLVTDVLTATAVFLRLTSALCEMSSAWAVSCCRRGSAGRPLFSVTDSLTFLSALDSLPDPPSCPVRFMFEDITSCQLMMWFYVICDHRFVLHGKKPLQLSHF